MSERPFSFHDESTSMVHASVDRVLAYLDVPMAMAAHMGESSMTMGSRMSIGVDAEGGRKIGSKIRMDGSRMGISIFSRRGDHRAPPAAKEGMGNPRDSKVGGHGT